MARIAEVRPPASPASKNQVARRERILEVAAELGAEVAYERVQMQEVAKAADVALGTLYRYFPSKVHLFAELWKTHIDGFVEDCWQSPGNDPVATVGDQLVALTRSLLDRPLLCSAMVRAIAVDYAVNPDYHFRFAEDRLCRAVLHTLGRDAPSHDETGAVRLLAYSWWGVLVSALHRDTPEAQGEEELRLAARLLLIAE
ncbi:TetR family transcriptional regulator [Streptomyces europaeiscabiei]|uniref:TetR/AcrR family transcriptional regulator n=1 Tax=Streptomyces europaeiscabiei TaxID=146819 RepID=UPI002E16C091